MSETPTVADRKIARAAGVVMVGFLLANVTGLVRQVLVSQAFGTRAELDAFFAALRLPDLLFNLIAGGALASAFVPTFTAFLERDQRERAWRLASSIANLVTLTLAALAILAFFSAPWLVRRVLAPGFGPEQALLTVSLLRVMLLSSVIFGVSGLLMGVLNAHQHFLMPALAPTFYWLGWIVGVLALSPGMGVHGLAWGVVLGAGLHLAVQLLALRGRGATYSATLGLGEASVRQVGRLMAPRLVGVAAIQINFLVNTVLASAQPEGSLTAIYLAFAVMTMPQVVIAQAIAIAALPTFSAQVVRGQIASMRNSLATTLRAVLFLSVPASIGLILLREPLVALLLERGAFNARSTELVAWALLWYAAGLVAHALVEIVSRAFYALQDTRTPVVVGAGAMALNVIFSLAFSALFARAGWAPHGGLALANSLATAIECIVLLVLMGRRLEGLDLPRLRRGLFATALAATAMGLALWAWLRLPGPRGLPTVALGGVLLGLCVYWAAALVMGSPDARRLPGMLLSARKGSEGQNGQRGTSI